MEKPELDTAVLYGGPFDGAEVLFEREGSPSILALSHCGERVVYRLGTDGVWRHDHGARGGFLADKIVDAAARVAGMDDLCRILALTAVRRAMDGDFQFWSALVQRIDRRIAGDEGEEWKV